jgi:acetate kinase
MMNILVINAGSSSVKYQLIDIDKGIALAKGNVARIGMSASVMTHKPFDRPEIKVSAEILDHIVAIEYIVSILMSKNHGVIDSITEIHAIGHRVLHNPHNIRGINACIKNLPDAPQVAVFDTAFHHKMPPHAFIYGLPYVMYKRYGIRRYGFHGTSHKYVSDRAVDMLGKPLEELKIITAHLGNGASVAAIDQGVSVDTSMGFTPLEGLMMGTRSGDIDPAIILHIMGREELTLHEANTLLNKHSGLAGISGVSSDMREIIESADEGHKNAKLALETYCYRLKKYIASYAGAMGGLDALVFTAGVGENAPVIRQMSCDNLEFMGIALDKKKNKDAIGVEMDISTDNAKVRTLVIPTNEELVIATDTKLIVEGAGLVK